MATQQTESGLGTGAKVGIAVVAVVIVGALLFGRGSNDANAPEVSEVPNQAPVKEQTGNKVMGQRFSGSSDETGNGAAPKLNGKLDAKSKARNLGQPGPQVANKAGGSGVSDIDLDKNPDDIPTLRRVIKEDPDPERRLAAVTLLGVADTPEAVGALADALSDEDENVRMEAVLALADLTEDAPVEVLSRAMNDPSAEIRYEALDALSDIETPEATKALQAALQDPDEEVRELAEISLDLRNDSDH